MRGRSLRLTANVCVRSLRNAHVNKPPKNLTRMPGDPPRLTIIAGANGCGKSTFTARSSFVNRIPLLDPDAISKALQPTAPGTSAVAAGRKVLNSARQHIQKGEGFAVETTLSGKSYLQMMLEARTGGFEIVLVYIGTERVEINLGRIRDRVVAGGHNVPEVDVRRRYLRSFQNLAAAISRADHTILFDNSTEEGYRLVAVLGPSGSQWFEPVPDWAKASQS
jgi:predicted ABC-type ATPase